MIFPGWTVVNAIPYKYWAGLLTKQYVLTGGVIRYAAGLAKGGQIVTHLVPAGSSLLNIVPGLDFIPGLVANFQLHKISGKIETLADISRLNTSQLTHLTGQVASLSQVTQQVLQVAAGTALLSGLSLAVSSIGFVVVNHKLNAIDTRLKAIYKEVKAIHDFLQLKEHAELTAALKDLLKIGEMSNQSHRNQILNDRRQTLMALNEKYGELLKRADTLETAIANEEYFSLTGLAYTRCTSELEMLNVARRELHDVSTLWKQQALRITNDFLIGQYPERFLASDFAEHIPISTLVEWLDFAKGEQKGYEWIDELRKNINEPWYRSALQKLTTGSGLNKSIGVGLEKEKSLIIPTLQKLVARNNVFEGYLSQYEMLESQQMTPSIFEQKMAELPEKSAVNGYYILEPTKTHIKEISE